VVQNAIFLTEAESACYEDLKVFYAPGECYNDTAVAFDHEWADFWESHNWTLDEFNAECKSRGISNKWVHFNLSGIR